MKTIKDKKAWGQTHRNFRDGYLGQGEAHPIKQAKEFRKFYKRIKHKLYVRLPLDDLDKAEIEKYLGYKVDNPQESLYSGHIEWRKLNEHVDKIRNKNGEKINERGNSKSV